MIYNTGTITTASGSSVVKGTGTKWNSNNPLVSPGMLMLIKNGDINYPYMILAVNSDTELTLADKPTFSATDTTYSINLTEPNNNSDAARALVAANTYILYFLQNMDTWMGDNGVVEITLPSGKTVKLESIKALQELVEGKADASSVEEIKTAVEGKADASSVEEIKTAVEGKADASSVEEIKTAVEGKADASSVTEISENLDKKYDKTGGQITGDVQLNTGKIKAKNANNVTDHVFQDKNGTLMHVGDFGIGIVNPASLKDINVTLEAGFYSANGNATGVPSGAGGTNFIQSNGDNYCFQIGKENLTNDLKLRIKKKNVWSAWVNILTKANTTFDANGFLKRASPIVKIHPSGSFETNEESAGVNVQRTGLGVYFISGVMGYNSDGGWGTNSGASVPKNNNGLELIYIKDKILPDGNIEIQTFHRQHSHLPEDFQNWRVKEIINEKPVYYADGEQVDIPPSTWLDIRVEMPVDSIWNRQHAQN